MKLFDVFKKRPGTPSPAGSTQQAPSPTGLSLEELLKLSATEPAYRPEFYNRVLSGDLVVITAGDALPLGPQVLKESTEIKILSLPDGRIPVFTSTDRIFDKQIVKEKVDTVQMTGQDLFALAKGATFVLNPYSDYGKELLPGEIENMLSGDILSGSHEVKRIQEATEVQIGQPSKYPTEIVNSLKILFAAKPEVRAAYVAWIYVPGSNEPPHYIFGIAAEPGLDPQNAINEAGLAVKGQLPEGEFVDFILLDGSGGVSSYFNEIEPFYRK
jgi:hypothetical protein